MNKGKTMRRVVSALMALLICMSCIYTPMAYAADTDTPIDLGDLPLTAEEQTAESELSAETDEQTPTEEESGQPDEAALTEQNDAAQAFVDAVAALDREYILSTANAWGLAHLAWLEDQADTDRKAALDEAVAASDKAAASLYAAEDMYYEIPEDEQESEIVQAAYLSLMSIVVAMQAVMDNPTAPTDPGTEGGNEPPSKDEITNILYADLPDAPLDYYMGSYGLPVAVGQTKIGIGAWNLDDTMSGSYMDVEALNVDGMSITAPMLEGESYAIVPILAQVEYPANGSSTTIILPENVTLMRQDASGMAATEEEAAATLKASYHEASASTTGIFVRADEDFTVRFIYTGPDGETLEKTLHIHLDKDTATNIPTLYGLTSKRTTYADRPAPSVTSGRITRAEMTNGTWLIWFNDEPAYCCDHGKTGKPAGCPTYSYAYTSIVEAAQYTPNDHYANQVNIWGGLGQLSLGLLSGDAATFSTRSEDETADICYDATQRWVMENYPDSVAAKAFSNAVDQLVSGITTFATDKDYYAYIYQPPLGSWQQVAVMGPPTDGSEPPDVTPQYYADWSAPAQSVSGAFSFSYKVSADKQQLATAEKIDGAVIEVEPLIKSGTIDGGSWAIAPAGKQTITTSGHTLDENYHINGGDGSVTWQLNYSVTKTSGTRSGSVGPFSSQAEADAAADSARENAIRELHNEAQRMVDAAVNAAKQQLASLQFSFVETRVPYGFCAYTGTLGSNQVVSVPANIDRDYTMRNEEWNLQVRIDKRDSETGNQIAVDTTFAVYEWDVATQRYIPCGGYNQYVVERQSDGTYAVINHSGYATADPASHTMYYTQRNEGKFIIVEVQAPNAYYGDWTDVSRPVEAGSAKGKRAYYIEITAENDGSTIWLDNADYNANIGDSNKGGTLLDTGAGLVTVTISDTYLPASKTYITDKSGIAANEDGRTVQPMDGKFLNDRMLGEIILSKVDLDAMRYLAAGSNGNSTLENAIYDLYAAEDIHHPDGVTGVVNYAEITDENGAPLWHTTVLTNGGWDDSYLPVLKKDHLVASAAVDNGQLAFANLYLGRYYLVERATGLVLPLDADGQIVLDTTYPVLSRQLLPTGKTKPLAMNSNGEYTDYVYLNRYSAVAESRSFGSVRTWDGYYLSYATGYLCDETNHYVTLAYADETSLVVRENVQSKDEILKSGFSINKLVSTTGQPGPAIKLDGAGFTVYRINDLSRADEFVQNPDGSYQVQSILDAYRADSYDQDTPKYDFSGETQAIATMYEGSAATVDAYNVTLTASGDNANGSGMGWQPTNKPGEYRLNEIFSNEDGILRVDGLSFGQYLIVETTVPKDVFQAAPFIVTVDATAPQSVFCTPQGSTTTPSGSYMTYNVLDEELEGYLQLVKIDAETGKPVKLAKTAFSIYYIREDGSLEIVQMNDPTSGNATVKTDVFYTDENGLLKTPEKLPLGRFRVIEVQGPDGFYNDESYYIDFEITSERAFEVIGGSADSMDDYIITERYVNRETLGQLTIRKMGEMLIGFQNGQFEYKPTALPGATFEIRAHGDIATADHQTDADGNRTLWYADGDLVATVTTGADGQIDKTEFAPTRTTATYDFLSVIHNGNKGEVSISLPLGSFDIREIQAPYAHALTNATYTVTFGWANQSNDVVLAETIISYADGKGLETAYKVVNLKDASDKEIGQQTIIFTNDREKAKVGVYKVDAETGKYLAGAVFELYTADDIFDANGNLILSAGEKIATSPETSEDGYTYFDADIPLRGEKYGISEEKNADTNSGNFYILEVSSPAGHYLSDERMECSFTYDGQAVMVLDNTCSNAPTEMWVSKQDITNGEELPGATLRIVDKDSEVIKEWISGEEPQRITSLHIDEVYTLVEQIAPDGFTIAEAIRFKLMQKADEDGNLLNEVDVFVCVGKDWLIFDKWEKLDDSTVVMLDARKPEKPHEPEKPDDKPEPTPTPSPLPLPKTGDLPWLPVVLIVTGSLAAALFILWKRKEDMAENDMDAE